MIQCLVAAQAQRTRLNESLQRSKRRVELLTIIIVSEFTERMDVNGII